MANSKAGAEGYWSSLNPLRSHPAAALPPRSALSDPPDNINPEVAKAALEQVNKRFDALLAIKSSTETRALTLAGQCTTLLSAITAAVLFEAYGQQRGPLLWAGIAGGIGLFAAILFAYSSANPRDDNTLPGCLPDEVWSDLVDPTLQGPEFMARLMLSSQNALVRNENNQAARARSLAHAILAVRAVVPMALLSAGIALGASWLGHPHQRVTPAEPARVTLRLEPGGRDYLTSPASGAAGR